jgi:pyridoxamine 5'-phosphate oxidase
MSELSNHIANLREDFTKGTLSESDVEKTPDLQFEKWMQQAIDAKVMEVQAFNVCTVSPDNKPSNRTVYLREFSNNQFYFYTNFNSRKGFDIEKNNFVSACFFYPELERQIRIEGIIKKANDITSDAYFNARPRQSQIGAWSSPQSQKIKNRLELDNFITETEKKFEGKEVPRPNFWGGYVIEANYYEFWQGRKSRLHDRICYELKNNNWDIYRIAP